MEKSRYDGGTWNRTDQPRRALHSYFTRRANGPQLVYPTLAVW